MLSHKIGEIGAQRDVAERGGGQLPLHGGDRHHPVVGIAQMAARLFGADLAGALHQHAGDDLQAVGDPVLQLLQQDRLLAQQIVLELVADPGVGDVGDRQDQPDIGRVAKSSLWALSTSRRLTRPSRARSIS